MVELITGQELKNKIDRGDNIVIFEALPSQYYRKAHIPGALNVPHDRVAELAPELVPDKDAEIVVYCANTPCQNSEIAAETLIQLGYRKVFDYREGKEDWIRLGFPVVKGAAPERRRACCAS